MGREDGLPQTISQAIPLGNEEMFSLRTEIVSDDISHQSMARSGNFGTECREWSSSGHDTPNERKFYYACNHVIIPTKCSCNKVSRKGI